MMDKPYRILYNKFAVIIITIITANGRDLVTTSHRMKPELLKITIILYWLSLLLSLLINELIIRGLKTKLPDKEKLDSQV